MLRLRRDASMDQCAEMAIGMAPIATRCSVSVRPPTMRYTPSRDELRAPLKPISLAAAAAFRI